MQKNTRKEMEWIKLEDSLPRCCDDVLFTDGKQVYRGWLETHEPLEDPLFYNQSCEVRAEHWPENVTHWMPLPEPPGDK
jgi:hypothetical protein